MNTKKAKIIYEFDVLKFYYNMYRVDFFLLTSEFCIVYIFKYKFFNNSVIQDNTLNISPISILLLLFLWDLYYLCVSILLCSPYLLIFIFLSLRLYRLNKLFHLLYSVSNYYIFSIQYFCFFNLASGSYFIFSLICPISLRVLILL